MDAFEAVRTLLAVRSYQDKPVPDDVVKKIVDAAHLTASSQNGQPWHFVVVRNRETLKKLGELAKSGRYTAEAPLAIVVAVKKDSRFGVSDGSRAIQSMMLTAWSEGVGSNWVGFRGLDAVKELLEIPDEYEILAIVPFGYPTADIGRGKKKRNPLGEVVSDERFGQPFTQ
ncbi:MAG: nitroreductase family protein [Nitrolancea sp.]